MGEGDYEEKGIMNSDDKRTKRRNGKMNVMMTGLQLDWIESLQPIMSLSFFFLLVVPDCLFIFSLSLSLSLSPVLSV